MSILCLQILMYRLTLEFCSKNLRTVYMHTAALLLLVTFIGASLMCVISDSCDVGL